MGKTSWVRQLFANLRRESRVLGNIRGIKEMNILELLSNSVS